MDLDRNSIGLGHKPALIVVDVIKGFTDEACPLGSHCPEVVAANAALLKAFRSKDLPIFFTTVVYHHDEQASVFRKRVPALNLLTPTSPWIEIDPALGRRPNEDIIEKQWASAFYKTDLADRLQMLGVNSLVITGLTTSGCVRATVVDGLQYNYPVVIPLQAVGDRNQNAHEANLHDMHAKYGDVMDMSEVLEYINNLS
jgi:maleamate amidohydrolase